MTSVFSRVLAGELPGRFVYRDKVCAAFLSIAPVRPGHLLVVPLAVVDDWLDLDGEVAAHLLLVAQRMGRAVRGVTGAARAGLVIAGFEVPHVHLHVIPADGLEDLDFARADPSPDPRQQDDLRDRLTAALGA